MMLKYEELLKDTKEETLTKNKRELEQYTTLLDWNDIDDNWLLVTYTYAKNNGLTGYKARSFASELTLFLTGQIYNTAVELYYDEARLDSHLYKKFNEIGNIYKFINYLVDFYNGSESWYYEHIRKYLQFRLTEEEKEMFYNIPISKPKQKFLHLLKNFDYTLKGVEHSRSGELSTYFAINLTSSEHQKFLSVAGDTKTDKFLNLLYYYYQNRRGDE
ncbi:MAG: hypothetical protein IJI42_05530 [Methanobrevibacter sp.]|nr:hypothetical protein [Methanobrevibacter sp.]